MGGFYAYEPAFLGGVSVGVGSFGRDIGIVTGAGPGGGPLVKYLDSRGHSLYDATYAYDPNFHGGVNVAFFSETDTYGADVVVGPGPGGGPDIRRLGFGHLISDAEFFSYDAGYTGGAFVAAGHD
jgi:hypothetical protein